MITLKWVKGSFYEKDHRMCLLNAIGDYHTCVGMNTKKYKQVLQYLMEKYPDRTDSNISIFNDHPDTTLEEINKVCEDNNLKFRFV